MTAAWPVLELCPLPLFCQPISNEHETRSKLFSSDWITSLRATFFKTFFHRLKPFIATFSMTAPTCSRCLNVLFVKPRMLAVESKLFICVCPIPAWRQPWTTRELMWKDFGERLPVRCSRNVLALLIWPHIGHWILKVLAKPRRISFYIWSRIVGLKV